MIFFYLGRLKTWLQCTIYERDFDMIFNFNAGKNFLQSTRKEILNWFSNLGWLKTWLHSTMKEILTWFFTWSWRQFQTWLDSNMKGLFSFHMIIHFKKSLKISFRALWRKFWHEFPFYGASNLDCRDYDRDFDMIFLVKATQNFAAERYGIDFDRFFFIMAAY